MYARMYGMYACIYAYQLSQGLAILQGDDRIGERKQALCGRHVITLECILNLCVHFVHSRNELLPIHEFLDSLFQKHGVLRGRRT